MKRTNEKSMKKAVRSQESIQCDRMDDAMQNSLAKGLAVAGERHLAGHGYDATGQQLEALGIYKKANLYAFLQKYGDEYSDFQNIIRQIIDDYRSRLSENRTVSDWSVDFRNQYETEVSDFDVAAYAQVDWFEEGNRKFAYCVHP